MRSRRFGSDGSHLVTARVRATRVGAWTVVTDVDPHRTTTTVAWGVPVGSRDEPRGTHAGLTHLLEHLAFLDPPDHPAASLDQRMDLLGADVNAETWEEGVAFHATVAPEDATTAASALASTVWPTLDRASLSRERRIVVEEILASDADPAERAYVEAVRLALGRHPLTRRVAGTVRGVRTVPTWTLRRWRAVLAQHPSRTVCVVGPSDLEEVVDAFVSTATHHVQDATSRFSLPPLRVPRVRRRAPPRPWGPSRMDVDAGDVGRAHVAWLRPGRPVGGPHRHVAEAVATVVGDVNVGALNAHWLESGVVDEVSFGHVAWHDAGAFVGAIVCDDDRVESVVAAVRTMWSDVVPAAVTPDAWRTATSLLAFDQRLLLESTESVALAHLERAMRGDRPMDVGRQAAEFEEIPCASAVAMVEAMNDARTGGGDAIAIVRPT